VHSPELPSALRAQVLQPSGETSAQLSLTAHVPALQFMHRFVSQLS
jgi:hypothetical protein